MIRYRVKADQVVSKNGASFSTGEFVYDVDFPNGHAEELRLKGFLEADLSPEDMQPEIIRNRKDWKIEELTMSQLKTDLKFLGIEFSLNASKSELFERWQNL